MSVKDRIESYQGTIDGIASESMELRCGHHGLIGPGILSRG